MRVLTGRLVAVFDFITPLVSTDGIAMDDMLRGNEPLLAMLLTRYREKYA